MQIVKCNKSAIKLATNILKKGGLIIYPTETLYGAGVDATNKAAVSKLNNYKNRPLGKPYSIAVSGIEMARDYATFNNTAENMVKEFLPGPLTIIVSGLHKVASGIESEDGKIGIRIPDYKFVKDLVAKFGRPITATSANASYKKRPYKISDILDNLSKRQLKLIDLIIDAGTLPKHDPSTVIDTTLDEPATLRQGQIKLSGLDKVLSTSEESTKNIAKELWQKYEDQKGRRAIVFALQGKMGTGKTIFTKGLAKAIGINELVTSPTFTLENEYKNGNKKLFHFDAWRLIKSSELIEMGFNELINNNEVVSIEWAERVVEVIRKYNEDAIIVWVKIEFADKENQRLLSWGVEK